MHVRACVIAVGFREPEIGYLLDVARLKVAAIQSMKLWGAAHPACMAAANHYASSLGLVEAMPRHTADSVLGNATTNFLDEGSPSAFAPAVCKEMQGRQPGDAFLFILLDHGTPLCAGMFLQKKEISTLVSNMSAADFLVVVACCGLHLIAGARVATEESSTNWYGALPGQPGLPHLLGTVGVRHLLDPDSVLNPFNKPVPHHAFRAIVWPAIHRLGGQTNVVEGESPFPEVAPYLARVIQTLPTKWQDSVGVAHKEWEKRGPAFAENFTLNWEILHDAGLVTDLHPALPILTYLALADQLVTLSLIHI